MKNLVRNEQLMNVTIEELKSQVATLQSENERLKKNPRPANAPDFSVPVRTIKTGKDAGKILVRYKTQIEINVLQALMLAVKMKDIMTIARKCRTGKWVREVSMKEPKKGSDKEPQRNSYDNLYIVTEDGQKIAAGTVSLARKANNAIDTDPDSPANRKELEDRMNRFNELWKELEQRIASR